MVGFNVAGLRKCAERHEKLQETQLFAEAMDTLSKNKRRRKRKETATRRAVLAMK